MTETQNTAKKDLKKDLGAKARMSRHRDEMKELGFKHVSTHLPMDDLTFLDREKKICLLYTSPSPRDKRQSRMPSSA